MTKPEEGDITKEMDAFTSRFESSIQTALDQGQVFERTSLACETSETNAAVMKAWAGEGVRLRNQLELELGTSNFRLFRLFETSTRLLILIVF